MKKEKLRRWLAAGLVAAMTMTCLAGCGGGSTGGDSKDSGADGDGQVLKVAALESAYGADMWTEVAAAFEETHEGVTVEVTTDKKIEDKITPAMKSGDYPDVVHCATGRDAALTETLTKEKGLACLDEVLDMTIPGEDVTVKDKILPGFLDTLGTMPYNDGQTYYAPMFYSPCGLFYNAGLLKEKKGVSQ